MYEQLLAGSRCYININELYFLADSIQEAFMRAQHQAIAALTGLLEAGNEVDRCYAARALGIFGNNSVVDVLIARLRDEDIDVCVDAVEALRKIGNSKAIPPLIESLENDSSGEICTVIATALGVLGGKEATEALLKVAAERPERLEMDDDWDSWWDVQLEAVRALGKTREESAIDTLIEVMDNHEHQDIESEVLKALAQIKGRGIDVLIQRLQEKTPQSRRRAAKALGMVNTPEATRALSQALQDDAAEVRIAAISALAKLGAEKYLPAIMLLIRDKNEEVRTAAMQSTCKLASNTSSDNLYKQLLTLLNDPSGQVRNSCFNALSSSIENGALSAETTATIITSLNDPSPTVGASACVLLGKNGAASVIPSLTALLIDSSKYPMLRRAAAQALEEIGVINDNLIEALTATINDQEQSIRLIALTVLVSLAAQPQPPENQEAQENSNTLFNIVITALTGELSADSSEEEPEESNTVKIIGTKAEGCEVAVKLDTTVRKTSKTSKTSKISSKPEITLPTATPRVIYKEQKAAVSTLDAIAMDNVEATLNLETDDEPEQLDSDATHYLSMAEQQKKEAERMLVKRSFNLATDVRRLAARALADSGHEAAVAAFATIIQTEPDEELACEAVSSLGKIATNAPLTPGLMDNLGSLVAQLSIGKRDRRLACARTLGQLGNCAAIAPLLTTLTDEIKDVRIEAINAITDLVMDGTDPIKEDHMVLEEVSTTTIAEQFLNSLEDPENGVRLAAAKGLARLLELKELQGYTEQVIDKMVAAALLDGAQQTRPMGQVIRITEAEMGAKKLLAQLETAEGSTHRRFIIEMLEELFKPLPGQNIA